jgi:1,3-beta-galactosyl-N-acetylhexosamine phosphorylase
LSRKKGGFTLPGESGYEKLTLELAEKWGADVIRDSDGTQLSDELLNQDYGIYSTICIIRDHNEWIKKHQEKQQQTFLMAGPIMAQENSVKIELMKEFYQEQFKINTSKEAMKYWQVYDRTAQKEVEKEKWNYNEEDESVTLVDIIPFHTYTVNFLAYRIWEEISMYNHVTNQWDKEHLMQLDPCYPEAQEYLMEWMENWCKEHPATTVVRFTSLFYNFVWIWGADERRTNYFSDWGSYDFSVSPYMLDKFKTAYGYALTSEDFINQGKLHVTHMPPTQKQKDWMDFINEFVITFARQLVDIVHKYKKAAYLFYDDSWVGSEPYGERFSEGGFDGLIKCVFSGYEARLCSGVNVETHEIRLHPYLFPVGLGGAPTFAEGGNPTKDTQDYWVNVRRALLRESVQRIGLGGYLHLTEGFPDFNEYMEKLSDEFRDIVSCHEDGKPETTGVKVAVLHDWGSLRSWTLSGHFHETTIHDLIHVNEALAGLPLDVSFINFEDIKSGKLEDVDVVINAGRAGTAWSGDGWKSDEIVAIMNRWVCQGGVFIGINQATAADGFGTYFRLADVLGIDEDTGARVCHGRLKYDISEVAGLLTKGCKFVKKENLYLTNRNVKVLAEVEGQPVLTIHESGQGKGVYMSGFEFTWENTRMLLNLILFSAGKTQCKDGQIVYGKYLTDNPFTECAYYKTTGKLIVVNHSEQKQVTIIETDMGAKEFTLEPYEMKLVTIA